MQFRIINLSEVRACKKFSLCADHYMPVHKIDECTPELIKQVKAKEVELQSKLNAEIEERRRQKENDLQAFKNSLRK